MRNLIQVKSTLLLMIFLSYTMLSCFPSNDVGEKAETIERIQERLQNKDYTSQGLYKDSHPDVKNEMSNVIGFLKTSGIIKDKIPKVLKVAFDAKPATFQLASLQTVDEMSTLGIDDPDTFDQMVTTATSYYNGDYTYDQVRTSFTNLNSILLNYPLNYSGGSQFLTDRVSDGTITSQQRDILEAEINALLNATTESEVISIINTVDYELTNSYFSQSEIDQIAAINAGIEGMAEMVAITKAQNCDENVDLFQKTGGAGMLIGLAMVGIGYILYKVGDYGMGETIGYIGAAIFTVLFLDGWLQQ